MRALIVAAAIASSGCVHHLSGAEACAGGAERVVVLAREHRAHLCAGGVSEKSFAISLGRGGVDKRVEGDRKTPLGEYELGAARASPQFHLFVPVGYPTAEQRAKGFTGAAIGLHGPPRWSRHFGRVNGWFDWTSGCIALPTDRAIDEVAAWLEKHPRAVVVIDSGHG